MKKSKLLMSMISFILLISMLCACGKTPKNLSGKYVRVDDGEFQYLEFFSDGTYTSNDPNYEGSYSIDGNRLRLEGILMESKTYYFKVSGNTLGLSGVEDFSWSDLYEKSK